MLAEAVEAITGWDTSLYELMELGERMTTMARMFNLRKGFSHTEVVGVNFEMRWGSGRCR